MHGGEKAAPDPFGELAKRAADKGVRIAFENCTMRGNWQSGDWNIDATHLVLLIVRR